MAEKNFPDCKHGFHGDTTRGASFSPPLLLEEARHLVYVFCDKEYSSKGHRYRCKRSYCSLCRHFHKETNYKEGFEKYFAQETFKHSLERNGQDKGDSMHEESKADGQVDSNFDVQEKSWKNLTIEGLKMCKISGKSGLNGKYGSERNSRRKENQSKKCVSARNGCTTCEKRRESLQQNQEVNKRTIKIVLPPTDCKSRLSNH